jgi:hypothetical protein
LSFAFVVGTTSLSFFIGQLDVTIVTVALPRIAAELHAGLSDLQWVVDAYALAFAVAMLSAGAGRPPGCPPRPAAGDGPVRRSFASLRERPLGDLGWLLLPVPRSRRVRFAPGRERALVRLLLDDRPRQ